jgi:hypothetical protein
VTEASNAEILQELSRAQRDSVTRGSLPPIAPDPEPEDDATLDTIEREPDADPMPEDHATDEQRRTTPRVTRSQTRAK